jgi:ABC-type bacteriocin/lantibiotic exporter with double-glycine peptidase domain
MKKNYKIKDLIKNFYSIIKLFDLKNFYILSLLILAAMFLEVLSIGLIIPIIAILENENFVNDFFHNVPLIADTTHLEQISFILLLLCLVFIVKFCFLVLVNYKQYKYSMYLQSAISNKLIYKYLTMPYENYFTLKSSKILRNIKEESGSFVHGVLIPVINIMTELLVIIGIAILLVSQVGVSSFSIILVFIIFSFVYVKFSKKTILKMGHRRFEIDEKIINASNETFSGIREIKVNKVEGIFLNFFKLLFNKHAENMRKFLTYQTIPRLSIEVLLVVFLAIVMLLLAIQGNDFTKIITLLGLFGIAAVRLIPSTNKIMIAQQNIRFYFVSINNLAKELFYKKNKNKNKNKHKEIIKFNKNIRLSNINFSYIKKNTKVLNNLNISINKGDRIGIIGKTGSGKSTLVDIISGLVTNFKGQFLIDEKIVDLNKYQWGQKIGYVSQNTFIFNETIKFNISFNNLTKNSEILEVLNQAESLAFIKSLKKSVNTVIGEKAINLSGGQAQRLGIARSIFHKPELLILDEAFSGIDNFTEKKIVKNIFNNYKDMTIINIAHKGKSLDYCNKVFNLSNKKLINIK